MHELALVVPVTFIGTVGLLIYTALGIQRRNRIEIQKTLRAMIESGQQLTPEVLEKINGNGARRAEQDFRRGVVAIALGVGICLFGLLVAGDGNLRPFLGIACLPGMLGIAYLGLWRFSPRHDES